MVHEVDRPFMCSLAPPLGWFCGAMYHPYGTRTRAVDRPHSQQSSPPNLCDATGMPTGDLSMLILMESYCRCGRRDPATRRRTSYDQRHLELDPGLHTRIHTLVSAQEPPFLHTRAPSLTVHARERHYLSNGMERYYTLPRRWPHSSPHNVIFESVTSAGIFPRVGLT